MSAPVKPSFDTGLEGAALLAALHETSFDRPWSQAEMRDLLASPGVRALVMSEEGEPAGFALVRAVAGESELLTLCVRPQFRRTGLGQSLLEGAEAFAAAQGAERIFLEVSERNNAAIRLYEACGYTSCGRRNAYYPDGADARILEKMLG